MLYQRYGLRPLVITTLLAFCSVPAFAERPMTVKDAATLKRGDAKQF